MLGLEAVDQRELYDALDWLIEQQGRIEMALARRHLTNGTLVLYDLTSTYFEGRICEFARFGYNRDGKAGKLQIVFGLLCTAEDCPVAVEVFAGNTGDPSTLASQVNNLNERFALERVVLIGDRGMITQARLEETIRPAGLEWITAPRAPAIQGLVAAGAIQLSLFDQRDLAEITAPDYPGERLVVCRYPLLAEWRARKRRELLDATEKKLTAIAVRVRRAKRPLRGKDQIALAIGAAINHYKMAKHFTVTIADDNVAFARNTAQIDAEAALDGVYVPQARDTRRPATVKAYKQLAASRPSTSRCGQSTTAGPTACAPSIPVHARLLCGMAHEPGAQAILFDDHDKAEADAARTSIVAKAQRSTAAQRKAFTKRTDDGLPVHSFRSLLGDHATVAQNTMAMAHQPDTTFVSIRESDQILASPQ